MLAVLCCIYGYGIVCPSLVYAGLSLFIMCGPYVNMVVCVVYAYNLAQYYVKHFTMHFNRPDHSERLL